MATTNRATSVQVISSAGRRPAREQTLPRLPSWSLHGAATGPMFVRTLTKSSDRSCRLPVQQVQVQRTSGSWISRESNERLRDVPRRVGDQEGVVVGAVNAFEERRNLPYSPAGIEDHPSRQSSEQSRPVLPRRRTALPDRQPGLVDPVPAADPVVRTAYVGKPSFETGPVQHAVLAEGGEEAVLSGLFNKLP
jgi:hypothetical protein